jgi:hypothetical protein
MPAFTLAMSSALSLLVFFAIQDKQETKKEKTTSHFVNSTTDANGNQHPGKSAIRANGTITCTNATQSVTTGGYKAACYVSTTGSGGTSILEKGQNMGTGNGGTLTLTCNGQGYLTCQVRIDD